LTNFWPVILTEMVDTACYIAERWLWADYLLMLWFKCRCDYSIRSWITT
jgi:hypothetical protein